MCLTFLRRAALAFALAFPAIGDADAQIVAGSLRRSADSLPIVGALVVVADSTGNNVARALSNERGSFVMALATGGEVTLRVLRIGFHPSGPQQVTVPKAGRTTLTLYLDDLPIVLPEMSVLVQRHLCGQPEEGSVLEALLTEARKAIQLTLATLEDRRFLFAVETWRLRLTPGLETVDSVASMSVDRGWPIRSAPSESLRVWGFAREERDSLGASATVYYGPDASLLSANWFIASRCLQLVAAPGAGLLAMQFTPEHPRPGTDIAGLFVFDSTGLFLRELRFYWVGLPAWVPAKGSGGFVRFDTVAGGGWLPTAWSLRAPVPLASRAVGDRLRGYLEYGGRVRALAQ